MLRQLNQDSLNSHKTKIINADAFVWLEQSPGCYDFVVVDFPDPTNHSLGKLYTTAFYRLLHKHLAENGASVIQSTSPLFARQSFWCIVRTLESVGLHETPYHAYVPSFGEWGFTIASKQTYVPPSRYLENLKFLTADIAAGLFHFPKDMYPVEVEINRLNNQVLVQYYESEWHHVTQ